MDINSGSPATQASLTHLRQRERLSEGGIRKVRWAAAVEVLCHRTHVTATYEPTHVANAGSCDGTSRITRPMQRAAVTRTCRARHVDANIIASGAATHSARYAARHRRFAECNTSPNPLRSRRRGNASTLAPAAGTCSVEGSDTSGGGYDDARQRTRTEEAEREAGGHAAVNKTRAPPTVDMVTLPPCPRCCVSCGSCVAICIMCCCSV
jgi:hypothetical protein